MNPGLFPLLENVPERLHIIHRRLRIRHAYNRRETAFCRSGSAGMNIFFIRKPRIPEMHVYIHESRRRDEPFAVDDRVKFTIRLRAVSHAKNGSVRNYDRTHSVESISRTHNPDIFNQHPHAIPPYDEHSAGPVTGFADCPVSLPSSKTP